MSVLRELVGGQEHPMRGKVTLIGRDPACDIVVRTEQTSFRHAMIVQSGASYAIEDLESVNGVYVNGQRVHGRAPLRPGDRIEIPGFAAAFQSTATPVPSVKDTLTTLPMSGAGRLEIKPEFKLRAVLEISRYLSTALDLKDVLPKILECLFSVFPQADRGFILLQDPNTGQFVPRAVRKRHAPDADTPAVSRSILNQVTSTGRAVLSADAASDARFDPNQSIRRFHIKSIMCAPMLSSTGTVLGVIQLDTEEVRSPFREEDLEVLASATTQAATAVELAQLHKERRDLEAAMQIQKSFLPASRPRVPQLHFFDYYSSARQIGGDYYDYIPLPGDRLAVALGDVSGKGVPAALLMARLSAAARFALAAEKDVGTAMRRLNAALTQTGAEDRFVTFAAAILDLKTYGLTLVNAGHMPPLRRRAGNSGVEEVGDAIVGLPLGVMDKPYEQMTFPLERGDVLLFYTDGVSEARNPANDQYGLDRLRRVLATGPADVEALGAAVLADVRRFAAGRPQNDDLTIVCVGRD
ncbi:MAG TPA: SpoIIE family protein phosphatase [Gemmataceae bacterium]|nr:SpoIIE family protein phosphatase [Gemmataceae bacterium]